MTDLINELTKSMTFLAEKQDTIFIGQQIIYSGNPMSTTLENVPKEKKNLQALLTPKFKSLSNQTSAFFHSLITQIRVD